MSKKRKKKVIISEPFRSWMLEKTDIASLLSIKDTLKVKLEAMVNKMKFDDKIESVDDLYSLTIREPKGENARNIRLVGTILSYDNGEEIENKISLLTINTNTKLDSSTLEERVNEIEDFKCMFYAYRNLVLSIDSIKCSERIDLSELLGRR